jgi:hypothetical protein
MADGEDAAVIRPQAPYLLTLVFSLLAGGASAAPTLSISHLGVNEIGNRQWLVALAPDPSLFSTTPQGFGGVLSTELALEVTGADLVSVTKNSVNWPYNTPGLNPFTGAGATGLVVDFVNDRAFAALTSAFLNDGLLIDALQIETLGSGAVELSWGGHELLPGTQFSYTGSRLAQAGVNFDAYEGQIAVPQATADFDGDGLVDGADFLAWQRGLRSDGLATRAGGDADADGMTDGVDLSFWQSGFGVQSAAIASAANLAAVPEPLSSWLALIAGGVFSLRSLMPTRLSRQQASPL